MVSARLPSSSLRRCLLVSFVCAAAVLTGSISGGRGGGLLGGGLGRGRGLRRHDEANCDASEQAEREQTSATCAQEATSSISSTAAGIGRFRHCSFQHGEKRGKELRTLHFCLARLRLRPSRASGATGPAAAAAQANTCSLIHASCCHPPLCSSGSAYRRRSTKSGRLCFLRRREKYCLRSSRSNHNQPTPPRVLVLDDISSIALGLNRFVSILREKKTRSSRSALKSVSSTPKASGQCVGAMQCGAES